MRVAVYSQDSGIGKAICAAHRQRGDHVWSTTRDKFFSEVSYFELRERDSWKMPKDPVDRMYFCIAVSDRHHQMNEVLRINVELTFRFLQAYADQAADGTEMVIFSSEFGSIGRLNNSKAPIYKISKAALNMAVNILAIDYPKLRWTLYHPGVVNTPMTQHNLTMYRATIYTPEESATMCIDVMSQPYSKNIRFVGNKGQEIPW